MAGHVQHRARERILFLIKNKKLIVKNILKITGSITHARTLNAQGAEIKSLL